MKQAIVLALALAFAPAFAADEAAPVKEKKDCGACCDQPCKDGKKMKGHRPNKDEFIKKYDKDGDGKLSDEEKEAMKADMEKRKADMKAKREEKIKKYDKDGDGKLSDEEKEAMKADWKAKKAEKAADAAE